MKRFLVNTLLYLNFDDQPELALSESEVQILRKFLERGLCYIDAGINEFIGANRGHSFKTGSSPEIISTFEKVFPGSLFRPFQRTRYSRLIIRAQG